MNSYESRRGLPYLSRALGVRRLRREASQLRGNANEYDVNAEEYKSLMKSSRMCDEKADKLEFRERKR